MNHTAVHIIMISTKRTGVGAHVSLEQRWPVESFAAHLARQEGALAAERSRFHRSRVAHDHVHVVVQRCCVAGQRVG